MMGRTKVLKRALAYLMALCLLVTGGFFSDPGAIRAAAEESGSIAYFYNSEGWNSVNAYVYGATVTDPLGGWPGQACEEATSLGENWWQVEVPCKTPYNIIFFNPEADSSRQEIYIGGEDQLYVTMSGTYGSKEAAEAALAETPTTVYFLNFDGEKNVFDDVYVYAYADDQPVGKGWPGTKAEEVGDNWYVVSIPRNASTNPMTVIVNDNNGSQLGDLYISSYENNYIAGDGKLYDSKLKAESSVGIEKSTEVYFLNNKDWPTVNCYIYGNPGEALGSWPGKATSPAEEMGEKWLKVTVPAEAPFNIIFFNTEADQERTELLVEDAKHIYVTGSKAVYSSKLEAELAEGLADPSQMTTLYFYDYRQWGGINNYSFEKEVNGDEEVSYTIGAGWPGKEADKAEELGENWWKVSIPKNAETEPFYTLFNDGINQTDDILIDDKDNVYITPGGQKFPTAAEAEEAAGNEKSDEDDCEQGPNADLEGYAVEYTGAGAALPYVTYEAEDASTNGKVLEKSTKYIEDIQSEASGRSAVKLEKTGDYVEFELKESTNSMVLRYCIPDNVSGTGIDATLSIYVNGEDAGDLDLTSKYAWVYGSYPYNNNVSNGKSHRYFDEIRKLSEETFPAGTKIRLQKDAGDDAEYYIIDLLETENVEAPATQPEGSLSVTDFGAVADDGQDDYEAFVACLEAAAEQDKEVWIPAGNFDLVNKKALEIAGQTVRGAGMWHTNLNGAGAAFKYQGTSKFYDFAINGVSTVRDDKGDLAAFEGNGKACTNVTIQNIWIEHTKVGVWSANTERLVIQGCRIRNTYADGINLCSGTNNATVRNNTLRNTGDDCIAIWPWLADCSGNTITHNTVSVPTLANGIALYGGSNNSIVANHICDIINNGAGIDVSTEFDIKGEFGGKVLIKDNELDRCGSMQTDENYPIGAIWFCASWRPIVATTQVTGNILRDCAQEGILLECNSELSGVNMQHNIIDGATDAVAVFEGTESYGLGKGAGKLGNLTADNLTGAKVNNGNPNFILEEVDEEIIEPVNVLDKFSDLDKEAWYVTEIQYAFDNGIMIGTSDSTFSPDDHVKRAQVARILYNCSKNPEVTSKEIPFIDVEADTWYTNAVIWAKENNVVKGYLDGSFGVNDDATREQLAVMLYNYADLMGFDTKVSENTIEDFADVSKVDDWAKEAMNWAVQKGVINGKPGKMLDPLGVTTRAEAAAMVGRMLKANAK